jgi:hypothetical protein
MIKTLFFMVKYNYVAGRGQGLIEHKLISGQGGNFGVVPILPVSGVRLN